MDEQQVIERIKREVKRAGSYRALGREWGITPPYICDLIHGRRSPGAKVLKALGLRKIKTVTYTAR